MHEVAVRPQASPLTFRWCPLKHLAAVPNLIRFSDRTSATDIGKTGLVTDLEGRWHRHKSTVWDPLDTTPEEINPER
jgi:hypothetical protein